MKKIIIVALATFAALTVSCNKQIDPEQITPEKETISIKKSFKVVMPETRAYLGDNEDSGKKLVKFADGDLITIFANTSGNSYTGTYDAANNEFSTEITEQADANESVFYAVYPAKYKNNNGNLKDWLFTTGGTVAAQDALNYSKIAAVPNGVDENLAVMLASVNESGDLAFRYGCAFIRMQMPASGIKSISFDTSNKSARYGGRPTYSIDAETIISDHQGSQKIITVVSGTALETGVDYYIPIIPKASSNGIVKITFSTDTESKSIETPSDENNAFYKTKMTPGIIYNLGCPPVSFSPSFSVDDITIEQDATSGEINYTIINPASNGEVSAALDDTYDNSITNLAFDSSVSGKVLFTCDANNTSEIRSAKVILTYSYNDSESVAEEVLISQKGGSIDYVWNFSQDDWQEQFAEYGEPNKDITNWNLTYDGLTIVSTAKSKYNTTFFQWGGKGSTSDRFAKFSAPLPGTLIVGASNTGDNEDLTRMVTVTVGNNTQSLAGGYKSSEGSHAVEFSINAGDVYIYPTGNGLRFYSIEFHSN